MFLSQALRTRGLQVAAGKSVTWADVAARDSDAVRFRHEMETLFSREKKEAEE
jgi:hypothetical protein